MTKAEMLERITDHLPAFLGFAINKTGSAAEAEELAQEIAVQCVIAVNSRSIMKNFDGYIWSIAHNTYKRWCASRRKQMLSLEGDGDTYTNIAGSEPPLIEQLVHEEEENAVRLALSRLACDYRKILVGFYCEELPIHEIGKRLTLSDGMVKFYLRAGRQKLREVFDMSTIGEKSYHPSPFAIYKSGIDFSRINVWEVFKRKLPCQIAIVCHDSAQSIGNISLETGTPAVYVEDEVSLLMEAGVMISPVKGKYRTNFHILRENAVAQMKEQFAKLFGTYAPLVVQAYDRYLPSLKTCDIFRFDASPAQWRWYFARNIPDFDYTGHSLTAADYPQILSCGSKAVLFAQAAEGSIWAMGQTPTFLENCTVYPCDVVAFGPYHRQEELWDQHKAQALYDVYCGRLRPEDEVCYAELIRQGFVIKGGEVGQSLLCNVAVTTEKSRRLFASINAELTAALQKLCGPIRENIARIVRATLPEQLRDYTNGYTETWIGFYAGVYLREALYDSGFLTIPQKDDLTPLACWISEK